MLTYLTNALSSLLSYRLTRSVSLLQIYGAVNVEIQTTNVIFILVKSSISKELILSSLYLYTVLQVT